MCVYMYAYIVMHTYIHTYIDPSGCKLLLQFILCVCLKFSFFFFFSFLRPGNVGPTSRWCLRWLPMWLCVMTQPPSDWSPLVFLVSTKEVQFKGMIQQKLKLVIFFFLFFFFPPPHTFFCFPNYSARGPYTAPPARFYPFLTLPCSGVGIN